MATEAQSNPLLEPFTWASGGRKRTPGQIEKDEKIAALLMKGGVDSSPIQHWTQGGARVMQALAGVMREKRAENAMLRNADHSNALLTNLISAQSQPAPAGPPITPQPQQQNISPFAPPPQSDNSPFGAVPDLSTAPDVPQMTEAPVQQPVQPSITESPVAPTAQMAPQQQSAVPQPPAGANIMELTPQDVNRLRKLVLTEAVHGLKDDVYNQQVGGIVDTALNRLRSGQWGKDLPSVLNAPYQFSDINGPVSWRSNRKSVDDIPDSWLNTPNGKRVMAAVDAHLANRASNPPQIGGHLNYANPYYSDASNLSWINKLDGPRLGEGKAIHWHGTAGNNKPVDANYFLRVAQVQAQAQAQNPQAQQPQPNAQAQQPPVFLGDSHAPALAQFAKGRSLGVNGATIAQSIQQLQNAPQGSTAFLSAGTNDAVGQFNEQKIREQVAMAAQIAKQRGINLTWSGPTGPKAQALDAILADATKQNGINYRSMTGGNFAMQPDGIHAQISPQGYGAMWNALQQQPEPQAPQETQPFQVASLGPVEVPQGVPQAQPMPPELPQGSEQVAQAGGFDINNMNFRAPSFAQQRPAMPQQQAPQQQPQPQNQLPPRPPLNPQIVQALSDPYVSPQVKQIAGALLQQHMTANQPKNETKVLPNGDVVIVDERSGRVTPVYSAPKTNFGVIGKDEFGRDKYGFINPNQQSVRPYETPQSPQTGPSVIPPVPPGTDPKVWNEHWSKKLTTDALGPTDENVTKLRGEIRDLPSYKNMAVVAPAYNRMVKSAGNDNRASDLSLVYTFMKMLDPGSVVRESEVSMAQNVPTLPEQYRNSIMSFVTGQGRLDPKVREALLGEAKIAAQSYRNEWERDQKLYQGIMQRRKINKDDVYSDFEPFVDFTPPANANTPPAGVDQNLWKYMTPEERKLWQKN